MSDDNTDIEKVVEILEQELEELTTTPIHQWSDTLDDRSPEEAMAMIELEDKLERWF
jgi:hypothetical protein